MLARLTPRTFSSARSRSQPSRVGVVRRAADARVAAPASAPDASGVDRAVTLNWRRAAASLSPTGQQCATRLSAELLTAWGDAFCSPALVLSDDPLRECVVGRLLRRCAEPIRAGTPAPVVGCSIAIVAAARPDLVQTTWSELDATGLDRLARTSDRKALNDALAAIERHAGRSLAFFDALRRTLLPGAAPAAPAPPAPDALRPILLAGYTGEMLRDAVMADRGGPGTTVHVADAATEVIATVRSPLLQTVAALVAVAAD